jgi:hypothetical protein
MKKLIGYFDGTDSLLLTKLAAKGCGTIPIANYWDGAGKLATQLEPGDVDLLIGYLHKVMAPVRESKVNLEGDAELQQEHSPYDLLYRANSFDIPTLIIASKDDHKAAKKALGKAADFVTIVAPEDLEGKVLTILRK